MSALVHQTDEQSKAESGEIVNTKLLNERSERIEKMNIECIGAT